MGRSSGSRKPTRPMLAPWCPPGQACGHSGRGSWPTGVLRGLDSLELATVPREEGPGMAPLGSSAGAELGNEAP